MIHKLKSTLEKIRQAREQELLKNTPSYMDEESRRKQSALLIAESPFSVNHLKTMNARALAYQEQKERGRKKRKKTAYTMVQNWIRSGKPEEIETRQVFCDLLQSHHVLSYHRDLGYRAETIKADELHELVPLENMNRCIELYCLAHSSQQTYFAYAESLEAFINKDLHVLPPVIRKPPLSLDDVAKFFSYLEERALKSTTIRAYTDVLLCRTMFYSPLPAKKLFALGPPQKGSHGWYLGSNTTSFPVPVSFVQLWKALSLDNKLLPRRFHEDTLSKKITRLGKYANLSTNLNPSILRRSLKGIFNESFIIDS